MAYFANRLSGASAKFVGGPGNDFDGALARIFGGMTRPGARNSEELLAASAASTWVHLVSGVKASSHAATRWGLHRAGEKARTNSRANAQHRMNVAEITVPVSTARDIADRKELIADMKDHGFLVEQLDHPFLTMLNEGTSWAPNPDFRISGFDMARLMSKTVEGVGQWYVQLHRDGKDVARRMLPIPPHWVSSTFGHFPGQSIGDRPNYQINFPGTGMSDPVPARDLISYKVPHPANPYIRGSGDFNAADHDIRTDEQLSSHMAGRLDNDGTPPLLFIIAGLDEPGRSALKHGWEENRGAISSGMAKWLELPLGYKLNESLLVKELQTSVVDMGIPPTMDNMRNRLLIGGRVPPLKVGEQTSGNRAMAQEADAQYQELAVTPGREGARAHYQAEYFDPKGGGPPEYGGGFVVTWSAPEQTDSDSRDLLASKATEHFSRAQILRFAGENPLPGDEHIYTIRNNVTVWDQQLQENIGPEPQPVASPFGNDDAGELSDKMADGDAKFIELARRVVALELSA